jgi:hypothetical protein
VEVEVVVAVAVVIQMKIEIIKRNVKRLSKSHRRIEHNVLRSL